MCRGREMKKQRENRKIRIRNKNLSVAMGKEGREDGRVGGGGMRSYMSGGTFLTE